VSDATDKNLSNTLPNTVGESKRAGGIETISQQSTKEEENEQWKTRTLMEI
jgi:hypothetical protein